MKRPPKVLKTLLEIKNLYEERAQERLGAALSALETARKDLLTVNQIRSSVFERLEKSVLSGEELLFYAQGLEALFQEKRRLEEKCQAREKEVEKLRAELEKAHREKRVVEKLNQKLWQKYWQEEERLFWKELDDLTLMRLKGRA